jgi:polygalacturonase
MFHFEKCEEVTLDGTGTIEGQGFKWWVREFLSQNLYQRPFMIYFHLSRHVQVNDVLVRNAPYYHVVFDDCEFVSMQDAEIYVDIWGQLSLHQLFGTDFEPV